MLWYKRIRLSVFFQQVLIYFLISCAEIIDVWSIWCGSRQLHVCSSTERTNSESPLTEHSFTHNHICPDSFVDFGTTVYKSESHKMVVCVRACINRLLADLTSLLTSFFLYLYLFPYLSTVLRIGPFCFQAGGHKMRQNPALVFRIHSVFYWLPSVLWCCWLGGRNSIQPVKTDWWDAGVVMCLGRGADFHMAQLMPLPLTVSCSSK